MKFKEIELLLEADAKICLKEAILSGVLDLVSSGKDHIAFKVPQGGYGASILRSAHEDGDSWSTMVPLFFCSLEHATQVGALEEMLEWIQEWTSQND